jgi:hypothetical protein
MNQFLPISALSWLFEALSIPFQPIPPGIVRRVSGPPATLFLDGFSPVSAIILGHYGFVLSSSIFATSLSSACPGLLFRQEKRSAS